MRENRQEVEQLLRSYAERTGFPVEDINRLRAERHAERRRLLAIQADTAAQVTNTERTSDPHTFAAITGGRQRGRVAVLRDDGSVGAAIDAS